jgi:photosystem II stability/assembly factor-like uncharacterized protein
MEGTMSRFFSVFLTVSFFLILTTPALSQGDFWIPTGHMGDSSINALAFSPNNTLYAATDKGVYRSSDAGAHWAPIGPYDSVITCVASPANGVVCAGLISLYSGMMRTTDDGAHWSRIDVDTLTHINPISAMRVDASGNVLAGGILITYRSTDGGAHWSTSYLQTQIFGLSWITDIVPVPGGLVFAAHQSGVYRSSDDGISWELKIEGLEDTTARAIGYDQTGFVYAGIYGTGIFRTADNGGTWEKSDSGMTSHLVSAFASNSLDQVFAGTTGGGVFRTVDNGDYWGPMNSGLTNLSVKCLAMSPDGYLYAGTSGGGVFKSQHSTTGLRKLQTAIPRRFELSQNYPNPFNPSTRMTFSLPRQQYAKLEVYNILGSRMATLVSRELAPGVYSAEWDARSAPSGVYIYRLEAGPQVQTRKMILIR